MQSQLYRSFPSFLLWAYLKIYKVSTISIQRDEKFFKNFYVEPAELLLKLGIEIKGAYIVFNSMQFFPELARGYGK